MCLTLSRKQLPASAKQIRDKEVRGEFHIQSQATSEQGQPLGGVAAKQIRDKNGREEFHI